MSEEQTTFKVTDRRLFNADGSPRDLPPEEKVEKASVTSAAPAPAQAEATSFVESASTRPSPAAEEMRHEPSPEDEIHIPGADDPASFINFAMSLASNAAAALGMMEHPVTHQRDVDLQLAKHWIDVLGMLQHKTRGNLSPEEEQILEGWLADLRMQYVSFGAQQTKSRPLTGRDITGGR
jgi:hypothetical protein